MFPTARTSEIKLEQLDVGPVLYDTRTRTQYFLSPLAVSVWVAADGTRTIEEIAAVVAEQHPAVDLARVRLELDRLADSSLLENRVSPPVDAPVARRALLRTLASASLGGAVFLASGRAHGLADKQKLDEMQKKQQAQELSALRKISEAERKHRAKKDVMRLEIGGQQIDGTFDPATLSVDNDGKSDFLSLGFEVSTFGQKGGVKELADILKASREKQVPVTLSWGADLENTFKGTFSDLHVGFSLFLPEGTPVRMESLATLKLE
jgi:hypothetical protein